LPELRLLVDLLRQARPGIRLDLVKHEEPRTLFAVMRAVVDGFDRAPAAPNEGVGEAIFPMDHRATRRILVMALQLARIAYLDISDNGIGAGGMECLKTLFRLDKDLHGAKFDGSLPHVLESFTNIVDIASDPDQGHLTKVDFPDGDMAELLHQTQPRVRKIAEQTLRAERSRLWKAMNRNRAKAGLFATLPFDPPPRLERIIREQIRQLAKFLPPSSLRSHNGICEYYQLQLPYVRADEEWTGLPETYRHIAIEGHHDKYPQNKFTGVEKQFDEEDCDAIPLQAAALAKHEKRWGLDLKESESVIFEHIGLPEELDEPVEERPLESEYDEEEEEEEEDFSEVPPIPSVEPTIPSEPEPASEPAPEPEPEPSPPPEPSPAPEEESEEESEEEPPIEEFDTAQIRRLLGDQRLVSAVDDKSDSGPPSAEPPPQVISRPFRDRDVPDPDYSGRRRRPPKPRTPAPELSVDREETPLPRLYCGERNPFDPSDSEEVTTEDSQPRREFTALDRLPHALEMSKSNVVVRLTTRKRLAPPPI
jgi:hypothetical protein